MQLFSLTNSDKINNFVIELDGFQGGQRAVPEVINLRLLVCISNHLGGQHFFFFVDVSQGFLQFWRTLLVLS